MTQTIDYEVFPGSSAKDFLEWFLSTKAITIEAFCKNEHMSPTDFRRLAEETIVEWELTGEEHRDIQDASRHLVNHIRIKRRADKQTVTADPVAISRDNARRELERSRREAEYERRRQNAIKPADYIRSLGYDPQHVTLTQVMNPSWRKDNPPKSPRQ